MPWASRLPLSSAPPGTAAPLVDGLKAAGAAKIYVAESDDAANYLITPFVDVLASLVESAGAAGVVVAANADGKEIAGRLAARIGSGVLSDVVEVKAGGKGVHSIFGGAFTVEAQVSAEVPDHRGASRFDRGRARRGCRRAGHRRGARAGEGATRITSRQPVVAGDRPS